MKELIEVFRMTELSVDTRIKIIIQLGLCLNHQYGGNITELLVYELVKALDKDNKEVETDHYLYFVNKKN